MTDSKISVSYFVGAYGPTILVSVTSHHALMVLRRLFLDLSRGAFQEVRIQDVKGTVLDGLKGVTLKLVPVEERKALKVTEKCEDGPYFQWERAHSGWLEGCVYLIDGILNSKEPGHQYLTQEGIDDALIELSYQEDNTVLPHTS